ncbi:MAG: lysine--tRNA ligase [Planctomycetes bacterium]|nr:lysine--tRNA ligase [Planctomycetota bacterium]
MTAPEREARLARLERLRAAGVDPFRAMRFDGATPAAELVRRFEGAPSDVVGGVAAAGRLVLLRVKGRAAFAHLRDRTGDIQIYCQQDRLGEAAYLRVRDGVSLGDIVGVRGDLQRTRTGELTVFCDQVEVLSKALLPLPEKFHGLQDVEARYRQRYLDLIVHPESRRRFEARARITQGMRDHLHRKGFIEVETPVLQPLYGGAAARPFVTHHNTLGRDLYLRVSDELYLKRLIVGGMERVYEIAKDFRNEGIDRFHNPEFTMMECYQAYADYTDMMRLVEEMLSELAVAATGSPRVTYQGRAVDFGRPWTRLPLLEAIERHAGVDVSGMDRGGLAGVCERLGLDHEPAMGEGGLLDVIFSSLVEPRLEEPTFVVDYPVETTALAKRHRADPRLVERFEPFVFGREIGNAFSELNDPLDQRARMEEQRRLLAAGDLEAQPLDEDFLEAMEHGMPPTGGLGLGVDRLVMFLTDAPTIRDVLLFPQMREAPGVRP